MSIQNFFLPIFLLFSWTVQTQNSPTATLEKELATAKDNAIFFKKAIQLTDIYLKNQQNGQAEFVAQKALEVADGELQKAYAYAYLAKAQVRQGKPTAVEYFRKAVQFFKKPDPQRARELANEWLEHSRKTNQPKEITDAEKVLTDLDTPLSKTAAETGNNSGFLKNIFGGKRRELESQVADLSKKVEVTKSQVSENQSIISGLDDKNALLKTSIEQHRAEIEKMSVIQARAELLHAEERQIVAALKHQQALDSVQLIEQETLLLASKAELRQQLAERKLYFALMALIGLAAVAYFFRSRILKRHNTVLAEKNQIIQTEKQRSEELLLNILPAEIAEELKKNGTAQARHYETVSVLFTDFVNFTKIAEKMSPQELVQELDYCFKNFDKIIQENGLEKIKTIGDAYMCASGLPTPQYDHAERIIRASLAMQTFLTVWKAEKIARKQPYFEARIGVHTGSLVAGVVGSKKFAYDIWGDTVNLAARIESAGEAGKVNISEETHRLVAKTFVCTPRGKILTKSKGEIDMFFVEKEKIAD
jgi:adenylate cyclase